MGEEVKVWYDKEGDYLEVLFETKKGDFQETENNAVMKKIFILIFVPHLEKFPSNVYTPGKKNCIPKNPEEKQSPSD